MTPLDQQFNHLELGVQYPNPIIEIRVARKKASDTLWNMRKNAEVQKESIRILKKHTLSDRNRTLKNE